MERFPPYLFSFFYWGQNAFVIQLLSLCFRACWVSAVSKCGCCFSAAGDERVVEIGNLELEYMRSYW